MSMCKCARMHFEISIAQRLRLELAEKLIYGMLLCALTAHIFIPQRPAVTLRAA